MGRFRISSHATSIDESCRDMKAALGSEKGVAGSVERSRRRKSSERRNDDGKEEFERISLRKGMMRSDTHENDHRLGFRSLSVDRSRKSRARGLRNSRNDILILEEIGRGASGSVYKGIHVPSMRLVALKTILFHDDAKRKQLVSELETFDAVDFRDEEEWLSYGDGDDSSAREDGESAQRPLKRFRFPSNPYIVAFYDAFTNTDNGSVCLVLEYMNGGSLENFVTQNHGLEEPALSHIAASVLQGLLQLHSAQQVSGMRDLHNFVVMAI